MPESAAIQQLNSANYIDLREISEPWGKNDLSRDAKPHLSYSIPTPRRYMVFGIARASPRGYSVGIQ